MRMIAEAPVCLDCRYDIPAEPQSEDWQGMPAVNRRAGGEWTECLPAEREADDCAVSAGRMKFVL